MKNFKKLLAVLLVGLMLLPLAACGGKKDEASWKFGMLSSANNYSNYLDHLSEAHGAEKTGAELVMFDNLNAAVMALNKNDVATLFVDKASGDYIAAHNTDFVFVEESLYPTTNDYSMMTLDTNKEVYDILNNAIKDMKADGTLDTLIANELTAYINSDPVAKDLPRFDGAITIKVAVTGDVPPMDFVAADGKAAGFNVALLTEIANRAQVNFDLVQVDSAARATALSTGKVDVVFWAKNFPCSVCDDAIWEEEVEGTLITESYFSSPVGHVMPKSDK